MLFCIALHFWRAYLTYYYNQRKLFQIESQCRKWCMHKRDVSIQFNYVIKTKRTTAATTTTTTIATTTSCKMKPSKIISELFSFTSQFPVSLINVKKTTYFVLFIQRKEFVQTSFVNPINEVSSSWVDKINRFLLLILAISYKEHFLWVTRIEKRVKTKFARIDS